MADKTVAAGTKTCKDCGETKVVSEFSVNKSTKDGLSRICRKCTSDKNAKYRELHKDKLNANSAEWRKNNKPSRSQASKDRNKARMRERYANDPEYRERLKAQVAQRRRDEPEKIREEQRRWLTKNREQQREYHRLYWYRWKTTEDRLAYYQQLREKHRAKRQARRAGYFARRYGGNGEITNEYLYFLHRWQDHCCFYCKRYLKGEETIEHVVPLNRNGTNYPHNVVLSCNRCNVSKQDKLFWTEWTPDFVAQTPRLISLEATKRLQTLGFDNIEVRSSFWGAEVPIPTGMWLYDHEVFDKAAAVSNVLSAKFARSENIGARSLSLDTPTEAAASEFMQRWHLQGFLGGKWLLGLVDRRGAWKAMASFQMHDYGYELGRLCFFGHVTGGLGKIISGFRSLMPEQRPLFTYCDLRFGEGSGYEQVGFERVRDTTPSYYYANGTGLFNRLRYSKQQMAAELDWFDPVLSERVNAKINGLLRVPGAPQRRFVLNPK